MKFKNRENPGTDVQRTDDTQSNFVKYLVMLIAFDSIPLLDYG